MWIESEDIADAEMMQRDDDEEDDDNITGYNDTEKDAGEVESIGYGTDIIHVSSMSRLPPERGNKN